MKKKQPNQKNKKEARRKDAGAQGDVQRLQRALAHAGFGSRRECETFIEEGRVEVDGEIVTTLGTKVDPYTQKIFVDGQRLKMPRRQYFILNKPPGIVSTSKDPTGRMRVIDLIQTEQRVYNVGRLDQSSEGLILVTNDGDLANQLTHPRYGVTKTYLVQVQGTPTAAQLKSLVKGVYLAEGKARVSNIKFKRRTKDTSWLEIVLDEGRNREIRRLLARIGHKVLRLRRIAIGPLRLGELPLGAHRELEPRELKLLKKSVAQSSKPRRKSRRTKATQESSSVRRERTRSASPPKKKRTTKKKSSSRKVTGSGRAANRANANKKKPSKKRRTKSPSRNSVRTSKSAKRRTKKD